MSTMLAKAASSTSTEIQYQSIQAGAVSTGIEFYYQLTRTGNSGSGQLVWVLRRICPVIVLSSLLPKPQREAMLHPSEKDSPATDMLRQKLLAGQHYEMLQDWQKMREELNTLRFRTPTAEGWVATKNGIPNPGERFVYVYHPDYGVGFGIYTEAKWEDKSLWEDDWHGDMQFIRPRHGFAARSDEGVWYLLKPQPLYYFPHPSAPTPPNVAT